MNKIRRNIQTMIDVIKIKFQNKITSKDKNFIYSIINRLIHFKKANLLWYKNVKKSLKTDNIEASTKIK